MPFLSWLRRSGKKTSIEQFKPPTDVDIPESAPATPRHPDGAPQRFDSDPDFEKERPATYADGFQFQPPTEKDEVARDGSAVGSSPSSPAAAVKAPSGDAQASSLQQNLQGVSLLQGAAAAVNIDAPASEVSDNISEAFGQMIATSLQSAKWDRRAQALKAVGTVLKGLDLGQPHAAQQSQGRGLLLRDRSRCWRTCCQLLNQSMKDKVMPVVLGSHQLFLDTFAHVEGVVEPPEVRFALGVLVEHLIDRLGDSNLRLHESARRCILFAAQEPGLLGLRTVLSRLHVRLAATGKGARERTKLHFGVLDMVNFLLQHFQGRAAASSSSSPSAAASQGQLSTWSQEDVSPFVVAGMEDALGPRVRASAVSMAVTIRAQCGAAAVEPLLFGLRPAIQEMLREKFSEMDGGDEDEDLMDGDDEGGEEMLPAGDLMGLMVCGSAIRPSRPEPGCLKREVSPLPGSVEDEDQLMDGILEDAGMVFGGNSCVIGKEGFQRGSKELSSSQPSRVKFEGIDGLDDFDEEELQLLGGLDLSDRAVEREVDHGSRDRDLSARGVHGHAAATEVC